MQKMEIITASGERTPVPNSVSQIKISQPGATVKISIAKEMIRGAQKDGNNLILLEKEGGSITIEDFFKTEGTLKNKLILDEDGKCYEAKYSAENFTGLAFFPVKQEADDSANHGEMSTAAWLVPLLVATATGIGIAIHNNNSGSSHSDGSSNSKEKQMLREAQKIAESKDSALINAQKTLTEAVKAMQVNPSVSTIKAVEEASAAVKTAMDALNKASETLKSAIAAAKAKGVDTAAAEKIQKQTVDDKSSAENVMENAAKLVKTATSLLDESATATAEQAKLEFKFASDAATAANKQPSQVAIDNAKAKLSTADATLAKLHTQIEQLTQLIAQAKEQGFNVDSVTTRLKDLQTQQSILSQESKALASSVAEAEQSVQDLDVARKAVDAANEAAKLAGGQKTQAAEKLVAALALKEEVLKNNQINRVDEVNKAISEANKSLDAARKAAEAANTAAAKANADIDKINALVDPSLKPAKVAAVDAPDLQAINKGLQVDDNKTFVESVEVFVKSLIDSVSNVWQTITNSKSLEFLNKVVTEITSGIKNFSEVLGDKVVAVVKAFKIVEKALVDFFINKPIDFFKDVISITWQKITEAISETFSTIKSGFDAVISGVGKAIGDALKDMSLLDWVNPSKWVGLIKSVIFNSVSNIFKNVIDVLKTIPEKIVDFFMNAMSKYAGAFADKISGKFDVVKNAVTDVVKTLFDSFIKNPIEKLLSPILEKITDFLSHPIESMQKLVSGITDLVKDAFNIIKNIVDLPCKWIANSSQLIKDIYNSFKGDQVKNGDGSELNKLVEKMLGDQQSDAYKAVNSLLKSTSNSGDINLNKLVPETSTSKVPSATESVSSSNYHSTPAFDDIHSSLPVAA